MISTTFKHSFYIINSLFLLLISDFELKAQQVPIEHFHQIEQITQGLVAEGFQSIDIRYLKKQYIIAYENRVYRFEPNALKKVINITKNQISQTKEIEEIVFITKRNNLPMISTQLSLQDGQFSVSNEVPDKKKGQLITANNNSGNYKVELVLRPFFRGEFGNQYNGDPIIHLFDLRPKLNIYLWKGAHFSYESIIPISSEFKESAPHWGAFRNRVVSLTQQFRFPKQVFLNVSAGIFSRNRYGVSTEIAKYFKNNTFFITGKVGYTGHASHVRYDGFQVNKGWVYTDLHYLDYKVGMHYWLPNRNTRLSVHYGKVLNDKDLLSFEVMQQFKEVNLGFFAFKTNDGNNYGMKLAIPIFPKKYWKPKRFSIRPARQWTYQYLYGNNLAREYQAQGMFPEFPQDLNPHFVKFYLQDAINEN